MGVAGGEVGEGEAAFVVGVGHRCFGGGVASAVDAHDVAGADGQVGDGVAGVVDDVPVNLAAAESSTVSFRDCRP